MTDAAPTEGPVMERQTSLSPKAHIEGHGRQNPYVPHDVIDEVTKAGTVGFLMGSFTAGVRNAMSRQNLGISGFFTRQAPLVGLISTCYPSTSDGQSEILAGRKVG